MPVAQLSAMVDFVGWLENQNEFAKLSTQNELGFLKGTDNGSGTCIFPQVEQKLDRAKLILTSLFGFTSSKGPAELEESEEEVEVQHKKQVTVLPETVRDI